MVALLVNTAALVEPQISNLTDNFYRSSAIVQLNKFIVPTIWSSNTEFTDNYLTRKRGNRLHLRCGARGQAQCGQYHASTQGSDKQDKKKTAPERF